MDPVTRYFVSFALILASAFGAFASLLGCSQMITRMRWDRDSAYADSRRPWGIPRSMLIASYFSQYGIDWNSGCFVGGFAVTLLGLVFASLIG
jgi:hypothetical protein